MGVPGLWDLLRPAAARTSLSTLAKTAFHSNRHGLRALTIGIDASLWIFHAQIPTAGENPFLRTIFFKICTLLQQPILPVFVFDGPKKPSIKRGQRVAGQFGTADRRSLEFKALLNECGLEWWNAPGEAEAELAVMNRQGKIDAVLSDDVDALLFGATCLLRNNSPTLSGTQASNSAGSSKGDLKTYEVYRSSAIHSTWTSKANTSLATEEDCRMAMVFVALLAGGDYVPEGVEAFGPVIAFALANAGLSDTLSSFNNNPAQFVSSLRGLQARMVEELRTNASSHIGRRYPDRASKLSKRDPSDVFQISAIQSYLQPATSPLSDLSAGWPGFGLGESSRSRGKARNGGRGDMEGMARACEKYFEWGTRELVVKKFASESVGVFGAEIMASARRRRIEADTVNTERTDNSIPATNGPASQSRMTSFFGVTASASSSSQPKRALRRTTSPSDPGIPSHIIKIERTRPDPTNPELTELRLLYDDRHLVERTQTAMKGTRIDPKLLTPEERIALGMVELEPEETGTDKGEKADKGQARVWIADWLVREAWPELVDDWEKKQAAKDSRTAAKGRTKSAGTPKKGTGRAKGEDTRGFFNYFSAQAATSLPKSRSPSKSSFALSPITLVSDEEEEPVEPSRSARTRQKAFGGDNPELLVAPSRLPSIIKSKSPSPPRARPRSPIRPKSPGLSRAKSKSSSSAVFRTRMTRSASGSNSKPIEIFSSDEDEARTKSVKSASSPKRTTRATRGKKVPILLNSLRQNTLSPIPPTSTATKPTPSSRSKSSITKQPSTQTRLNMPIVSSQPTSSPIFPSKPSKPVTPPTGAQSSPKPVSPSKSRSGVRASPSPILAAETKARAKPRRSYILEKNWDEDGAEVMDCTRGGRLIVR